MIFALSIILSKLIHVVNSNISFFLTAEEYSVVYVYACIYMCLGLSF